MTTAFKADVSSDLDGLQVEINTINNSLLGIWRLDDRKDGTHLLYRMDKKPTSRTHTIVTAQDAQLWVDKNIESLVKGVM